MPLEQAADPTKSSAHTRQRTCPPGTLVIASDHNVHYGANLGRRAIVRADDGDHYRLADLMTGEEFRSRSNLWTPAMTEIIRVGHGHVRHFLASPELLRLPCRRPVQANRITVRDNAHTIRVLERGRPPSDGEILMCGHCEFALSVWRQQVNHATPITPEVVDSFHQTVADRLHPGPDFDRALRELLQGAAHWASLGEEPAAAAALGQAVIHATARRAAVSAYGWNNYINAAHAWVISHDIYPAWDNMSPHEQLAHLLDHHPSFGTLADDDALPGDTDAQEHAFEHGDPLAPNHTHHTRLYPEPLR